MDYEFHYIQGKDAVRLDMLHKLEQPLEQGTIAEMCSSLGVSRQTFYNYFDSKTQMIHWYLTFLSQFYLAPIGRSYTWQEGLRKTLQLCQYEQTSLKLCLPRLGSRASAVRSLYDLQLFWVHLRARQIKQVLDDKDVADCSTVLVYYAEVYVAAEARLLYSWITKGMAASAEEVADFIAGCVPSVLCQELNNRLDADALHS